MTWTPRATRHHRHHNCARAIIFPYPGHDEVYTAGDACYGAPGHLPLLFAGTELVEFSPTGTLNESVAVAGQNLQAARS